VRVFLRRSHENLIRPPRTTWNQSPPGIRPDGLAPVCSLRRSRCFRFRLPSSLFRPPRPARRSASPCRFGGVAGDRAPRQGHRDGAFPDRPYGRDAGGVFAPPPRRVHRDRAWYRRPEAGGASHSCRATTAGRGSGPCPPAGAPVMGACRGQRRCPRRTHMCIDRRCVPPLVMRLRENPAASSILPRIPSPPAPGRAALRCVRGTGTEKPHIPWHASGSDAQVAHSLYIQCLEKLI
jgi:hypothetical protein